MNHVIIRRGVHASAVGHGIATAIFANADDGPAHPEDWVIFCLKAAREAYSSVMEAPFEMGSAQKILRELSPEDDFSEWDKRNREDHEDDAREAGSAAFRSCMPKITGRRSTQAYIACIAAGVQHRYLTGSEAKALLYTAQLALSAHPSRRVNRGRKAN